MPTHPSDVYTELESQDKELQVVKNEYIAYAEKLNVNLDSLMNQWGNFYYEKYWEGTDKKDFLSVMREAIQWYIDDLLGKIEWDRWERYDKGTWIENKYKELLSLDKTPKQVAIIEKVWTKGKVLSLLSKILGK